MHACMHALLAWLSLNQKKYTVTLYSLCLNFI